ncbi:lamin tail domain-containing protein [Patescibacteria group bacterium]|nr:lamin tail domain-containing protein [Patescibacteria group bacterium]
MGILLITIFFFLSALPAQAKVVINEVYPAPIDAQEWIELYNSSLSETIDLKDWSLFDQLSSPTKIYQFAIEKIEPNNFLVIKLTSAKLNNSADGVTLKNSLGEIIDEMSYQSSEAGLSWSRNYLNQYELTQPTPGTMNLFPSPTPIASPTPSPSPIPTPSSASSPSPNPSPSSSPTSPVLDTSWHQRISITKFQACPKSGENEWIQLFNDDNQTRVLSDWKFIDASDQSRKINITISAKDYQQISWANSFLNNTGDTIILKNNLNTTIQTITYQNCGTDDVDDGENQTQSATEYNKPEALTSTSTPLPLPSLPVLPPLPLQPTSLYSLNDIYLGSQSAIVKLPSLIQTITTQEPSLLSTVSVILGGLLLFLVGSWGVYEKFWKNKNNS